LSQTTQVRIEIDPMRTPVHYTNAAAISSDKFGIVLDAGQRIASSNKVQIVARIGFSLEHAEEIEQALMSHIKKLKDERRKNRP
jgi:hypothetical protein